MPYRPEGPGATGEEALGMKETPWIQVFDLAIGNCGMVR
jgi:hypothetical protein